MSKKSVSQIVYHSQNGNEEQSEKFVEVEGKKFIDDGTGKAKLGEDGKPIPFVEKQATPEIKDLSKAELAELAKVNPAVADLLKKQKERDEQDEKDKQTRKEKEEKEAAEKGEFKQLAESRGQELEQTKGLLKQKDEQLGKYVDTVNTILTSVLATIPKENLSLIPDGFSPRQKLEYITKNAKLLGAKIVGGAGSPINKSEVQPEGTEEEKLVARFQELQKKGSTRTAAENDELMKVGTKIKEIRTARNAKPTK